MRITKTFFKTEIEISGEEINTLLQNSFIINDIEFFEALKSIWLLIKNLCQQKI